MWQLNINNNLVLETKIVSKRFKWYYFRTLHGIILFLILKIIEIENNFLKT